jgi:hypothetical protein
MDILLKDSIYMIKIFKIKWTKMIQIVKTIQRYHRKYFINQEIIQKIMKEIKIIPKI